MHSPLAMLRGLALALAVTTACVAAPPDLAPELEAQNEAVATLYMEGKYAEGVELTRRYLAEWTAAKGADSAEACSMASNLGPLLTQAGEIEAAEAAHREALDCLRRTFGPESEDLASALNNYGSHLGHTADFARAELALTESLRLLRATLGEDHAYVAITLNNLGVNQQNQGNDVAAERTMREATRRLRASLGPDHPLTATAVNNLGRLLASRGAFDEAELLLREALAVRDSTLGPEHRDTAIGLRDLGRLQRKRGDAAAAETTLRAALAAFTAALGDDHPEVAMSHHELGRALADQGRLDEARSEFETSLALFTSHYDPGHSSLVQLARELGALDAAAGHFDEALTRFLAAADAFEVGRERSGDGLSRATYLDSPWLAVAGARLLTGDPDGAWDALGRSQGRVLAEALFPGELPAPEPAADAPLLGWLDVDLGDGPRAWAWLLHDGTVSWRELDSAATHADAVRALREALASPGPLGRVKGLAQEVWRLRVAPLESELSDFDRVVIVPAGDMLGVPVGALVDDHDRWLADRWLLSYAPSPAVHDWLLAREKRADGPGLFVGDPILPGAPETYAALDSRRPSDAVIRGATHGLRESLDALPPLPGTRLEVEALAGAWRGSTVLLGADASESALLALAEDDGLRTYDVLHFATHALVDEDDADASALVLSQADLPDPLELLARGDQIRDGLVTSGEIVAGWRLDADLVVLSACNSALGRTVTGEGLVGFSHAFLRAGARATLVSQWSVPDRATLLFMSAFYEAWHGGKGGLAEALAQARQALRAHRDEDGRLPYAHPYYWAPFVLVGDER